MSPPKRSKGDRLREKWVAREAPVVLSDGGGDADGADGGTRHGRAAPAVRPPPRATAELLHPVTATGTITPVPLKIVQNRRLQPSPDVEPWSEAELLGDWAHEESSKALDYYTQQPEGMTVLKAAIVAQLPGPTAQYTVLQRSPAHGASLDLFAPEAWMRRDGPRLELPLAHADVQRTGRTVAVTVHAGVHPDSGAAGVPITFEWDALRDAKGWEKAIARAAEQSESKATRERVGQWAKAEEEERRQRAEAAARLEHEAEEIRARHTKEARQAIEARDTAAAAAAHTTLSGTAAAAAELAERYNSRARLEVPTVHVNADGRHGDMYNDPGSARQMDFRADAAEARREIAELRAMNHMMNMREPKPPPERLVAQPRVNHAAHAKQHEAAERRQACERRDKQVARQTRRKLEAEKDEDAIERAARWGPCRDGDSCTRATCKYSHPREFEQKKAAIAQAKALHEESRTAIWRAKPISQRQSGQVDFRAGLKLGLKKPLMLPSVADRVDPVEARRAIEMLKAKYHPHSRMPRELRKGNPAPQTISRKVNHVPENQVLPPPNYGTSVHRQAAPRNRQAARSSRKVKPQGQAARSSRKRMMRSRRPGFERCWKEKTIEIPAGEYWQDSDWPDSK